MAIIFAQPGFGGGCGGGSSNLHAGYGEAIRAQQGAWQAQTARCQIELQREHMRQQGAQFAASREVSPRDAWQAQEHVRSSLAIHEGQLTQSEQMRLQRLNASLSSIDDAFNQGQITQTQYGELRNEALGMRRPLQMREDQTQQALREQQVTHLTEQNRISNVMRMQNEQAAQGGTQPTTWYDPLIQGQLTTQLAATNPHWDPQQLQNAARAEMGRTGRGVRHVVARQRANGEVEWEDAFPSRTRGAGAGSSAGGGAGEPGGAPAVSPARDMATVTRLHEQFDKDWLTRHQPEDFLTRFTTPEAREAERRRLRTAWVGSELQSIEGHLSPTRHPEPRAVETAADLPTEMRTVHDMIIADNDAIQSHAENFPSAAQEARTIAARMSRVLLSRSMPPTSGPAAQQWQADMLRLRGLSDAVRRRRGGASTQAQTPRDPMAGAVQPGAQAGPPQEAGNFLGERVGSIPGNVAGALENIPQNLRNNRGLTMLQNMWQSATHGVESFDRWLGRQPRGFWEGLTGR